MLVVGSAVGDVVGLSESVFVGLRVVGCLLGLIVGPDVEG